MSEVEGGWQELGEGAGRGQKLSFLHALEANGYAKYILMRLYIYIHFSYALRRECKSEPRAVMTCSP